MKYDGYNGAIEVNERELTILREGVLARANFGKAGPRTFPLVAVAGVRFVEATRLKNGYLQILLAGEENSPQISATAAISHANAVLFAYKSNEAFGGLANWLNGVAARNHAHGVLITVPELAASGGQVGRLDKVAQTVQATVEASAAKAAEARARQATSMTPFPSTNGQAFAASFAADGAIVRLLSHDDGRNAVVALFPDRIERVKPKAFTSLSNANQDVEMTPIRAISSVQAKKDGFRTKVIVYASGNTIEFRFGHDDAARFRAELQKLMLQGPAPAAPPVPVVIPAPAPAPVIDVAEQLAKFAALKQQGFLTDEEFAAQKAKLLGL